MFIEGVSMLLAKAFQDHPLYAGQESSTRYLDFSCQPMIDPIGVKESGAIQARWMSVYNDTLPKLIAALMARHPFDPETGKSESAWRRAIEARAFDISRSLLPLGTATFLSWHTNLRQARDKLRALVNHPLAEVRDMAARVHAALRNRYSHSFRETDMTVRDERQSWADAGCIKDHILVPEALEAMLGAEMTAKAVHEGFAFDDRLMDIDAVNAELTNIGTPRPKGAPLPRRMTAFGQYRAAFLLDFGSFRDIQRHRNGWVPIPLVDGRFGFHRWYADALTDLLGADAERIHRVITEQYAAINALAADLPDKQYLHPMGTACLCTLAVSLPQAVYIAELRSQSTVHPSLRPIAQRIAREVGARHPDLMLFADMSVDSWSLARGDQTIEERK
ncbi:MAG: FAD-dependent thymidylate synthase [Pseudomonadota bacterium]|nr:FAD-dependent thymidylate synthase [Pseudomonadota bacterium]